MNGKNYNNDDDGDRGYIEDWLLWEGTMCFMVWGIGLGFGGTGRKKSASERALLWVVITKLLSGRISGWKIVVVLLPTMALGMFANTPINRLVGTNCCAETCVHTHIIITTTV